MSSSMGGYTGLRGPTGTVGNKIPSGYRHGQLSQYVPEQMQLFQQLFSHVSPESYLSRLAGGDQSFFGEREAPALRQFSDLQGNLASRFSGMGMGARRSSGFQNASTAAASNFAQELAARRSDLQRQAILDLLGLGDTLLGERPYETFLGEKKKKKSFLQSLLGGAAPAIGGGLGFLAGGPAGAMAGGQLGSAFGQAFM